MKLTRRQFSGSLLASTLASVSSVTNLSAQPADVIVVGVEHGEIVRNLGCVATSNSAALEDYSLLPAVLDDDNTLRNLGSDANPNSADIEDYTTLPQSDTPVRSFQALLVRYVNLRTLQSTCTVVNKPVLSPSDRISGVSCLADGTLLVAITPDGASANGASPTRLVMLNETSRVISVSGLSIDQALDSVLLLKNRSLIGMITKKDGTGPAHIVDINPATGAVSFTNRVTLPADRRFSCLAEAADGTVYTSVFRANATTELWTLDFTRRTATFSMKLTTFDGMAGTVPWYHGIQSLIVTPAGQLVALCNLEYRLPDSIYLIDLQTGFLREVVGFPVSRAALVTGTLKI